MSPSPKKRKVETTRHNDNCVNIYNKRNKRERDQETSSELTPPMKGLKIHESSPRNHQSPAKASPSKIVRPPVSNRLTEIVKKRMAIRFFIQSCENIVLAEFYNIKSRCSLNALPNCCKYPKECKHQHGTRTPTPLINEQNAIIDNTKSLLWIEALDVCRVILTPDNYITFDLMHVVIDITLNAQETQFGSQKSQMVTENCFYLFNLIINTHNPCHKTVRNNYIDFLTKPFVRKINYEEMHTKQDNIFEFVLNTLSTEFQPDSPSEPITYVPELCDLVDKYITISEGQILKKTRESYNALNRNERIKRLFLVLDMIITLLESDLAIWITKHIRRPYKYMIGKTKPLMAWLLWKNHSISTGVFNDICKQILQLYINVIKYNFPASSINIFSRLINVMFNMFQFCDEHSITYPLIGKSADLFATEMYQIIKDENMNNGVLKIIDNLKSKSLKHLLAKMALKIFVQSKEDNYRNLVRDIFRNESWWNVQRPPKDDPIVNDTFSDTNNPLCKIWQKFERVKNIKTEFPYCNKDDFQMDIHDIAVKRSTYGIDLLFKSFLCYVDLYNIEKILNEYFLRYQQNLLDSDKNSCEHKFDSNVSAQCDEINSDGIIPLKELNDESITFYRSTSQFVKEIMDLYLHLKHNEKLVYDPFASIMHNFIHLFDSTQT